jgi:hypothetical protein
MHIIYHIMVNIDDGDISLSQALAKFAESEKYLAEVILNQQRVLDANKPARLRSAAEQRHERRRNSFNLQMNIMGLATGGRVIPSLDNDDVRPIGRDPIVKMHAGSSTDRVTKSYELMRLFTGGR